MMISLKACRVNANLTIQEASKLLGIHSNTLAGWEKNPGKVREIVKPMISKVYQIPLDMIDWGTEKTNEK